MDVVCGGLSKLKDADEEVKKICGDMKSDVQGKTGKNYGVFQAVNYKTQLVAGVNYFIKVHVGGKDYIIIWVFQMLPCEGGTLSLVGVEQGKTLKDPIEFFPTK